MDFKERLKALRSDSDTKQAILGKDLNMTQRKISRMETGEAEPKLQDIKALCKYFDVSADYLLGFTNEYKHFPKN